ncbi:MAG TPA: hypothetical protein VIG06_10870 [Kofleriaceae bacterium]|jgi:hypothetical protein
MGGTESSGVFRLPGAEGVPRPVPRHDFTPPRNSRVVIGVLLFTTTLFSCCFATFVWYGSGWHHFAIIVCITQGVLGLPLVVAAFVLPKTVPDLDVAAPAMATRLTELPRLHRLKCPSCADEAPLTAEAVPCASCGTPIPVPPDVADALSLRSQATEQLGRSALLLQWARRVSRGYHILLLRIFGLAILCFGPFAGVVVAHYSHGAAIIAGALAVATSVAIGLALLRVASILSRTRKALPRGTPSAPPADAARAACSGCGSELDFAAGQVAQYCPYCGSETLRARVAVETALRDRFAAYDSLTVSASIMVALTRAMTRTVRRTAWVAAIAGLLGGGLGILAYVNDDPSAPPPSPDRWKQTTGKRHKASQPHPPPTPRPADR